MGGNGSGKTTLLNIIAGLDTKFSGRLEYNIDKSDVGMIFQNYDYMIFPWLTVEENLILGNKTNIGKVRKILQEFNMLDYWGEYAHILSGGMKQLLCLVREISNNKKLIILDEPFSSLDIENKNIIVNKILMINQKYHITFIIVVHDVDYAQLLSDRIILLSQNGSVKKVLSSQRNLFDEYTKKEIYSVLRK